MRVFSTAGPSFGRPIISFTLSEADDDCSMGGRGITANLSVEWSDVETPVALAGLGARRCFFPVFLFPPPPTLSAVGRRPLSISCLLTLSAPRPPSSSLQRCTLHLNRLCIEVPDVIRSMTVWGLRSLTLFRSTREGQRYGWMERGRRRKMREVKVNGNWLESED